MKIHNLKYLFIIVASIISPITLGASNLNIVVGLAKPPYVFEQTNSGYELEFISAVLNKLDRKANFIFVPFGRTSKMLDAENIDAILTTNNQLIKDKEKLSDVYITYRNVAISLKSSEIKLNDISELSNYSLATFQLAHRVLGREFSKATKRSPMYTQISDQKTQLELLIKKRVEVVVMDINIARYFLDQLEHENLKDKIDIHHIFPLSDYRVAFSDKTIIPAFNNALALFKRSKEYLELQKKYEFE